MLLHRQRDVFTMMNGSDYFTWVEYIYFCYISSGSILYYRFEKQKKLEQHKDK